MSQPLTLKIPIKNRHGEVVGEKEVVSYAGLLAKAHDEGLEGISTELVQVPTDSNGSVAIRYGMNAVTPPLTAAAVSCAASSGTRGRLMSLPWPR